MSSVHLTREVLTDFAAASGREWLITNGIGGFACSTLIGMNSRRYHGLLIASLHPPVDRVVLVAKLDAVAHVDGVRYELACNEYADGTIAPTGFVHLDSFRLDGSIPVWTWLLGTAVLEQRAWMPHGQNTTYVQYRLLRGEHVDLEIAPLCTHRDYHSLHRGQHGARVDASLNTLQITSGDLSYCIVAEDGEARAGFDHYWNLRYREESARGLDDIEDLFRPGTLRMTLEAGESRAVILTTETTHPLTPSESSLAQAQARQSELANNAPLNTSAPDWIRQLVHAADQFIVERASNTPGTGRHTVIAGYPWFADWGRDTMIALPGLTLATGRYEIAASVLRTFARYVSEGMLPNRFPDGGEIPEYNTVDATLWYFVAIDEYVRLTGDSTLLSELFPTLRSIVRWHQRGTRFGIQVDPSDGLLRSGTVGAQLTWMDAKIGDWVVTPRTGKAVEINALWFNALSIMRDFAVTLNDVEAAREYWSAAERVAASFNARFWFEDGGYLYDVIDAPEGDDPSLRPNQLFAISLRHALLDNGRAKAVVDVCAKTLWTPVGLRSLAAASSRSIHERDARYAPRYIGGPSERDAIYHQGTTWSWLIGPFVCAHFRVYQDAARAREYLASMESHLREACVGQISEIFDGDAPFTPRGCFAQAWGVAEVLRAWRELDQNERSHEKRSTQRKRTTTL
ncbi:MAG: amylo-alpha-1,6-glucosidase [Povalibacter sp.]